MGISMKKDYKTVRDEKKRIRKLIWDRMVERGVARFPLPPHNRIPNFENSRKCSFHLERLKEWREAEVVKVNPDSPQKSIRYKALKDGKILVMPTPRLREGFLMIEPENVKPSLFSEAVTIRGSFKFGKRLGSVRELEKIGRIDFIVEGSVAVNRRGERLGKGEGYGDIEFGILREIGLIEEDVPIATTVHEIQVLDESIPQSIHDVSLDYIITPKSLIRVERRTERPSGILREILDDEKIQKIPLLREILGIH